MHEYFLSAPDRATMIAVLASIWQANGYPAPPETGDGPAEVPSYSDIAWVSHGWLWVDQPAVIDGMSVVSEATLRVGYHALLRLHHASLGPEAIASLAAAGVTVQDVASVTPRPIQFQ